MTGVIVRRGRVWWWVGASLFAGLGFIALGRFLVGQGLEDADRWASVLGVFLNVLALLLTVYTLVADRRSPPSADTPAELARELADAVCRQWAEEAEFRDLNDPYPLPVTWELADHRLFPDWTVVDRLGRGEVGRAPGSRSGAQTWAKSPAELVIPGRPLVESYRKIPTGRLVLLGEPGSGKTTLMLGLVLDLIADRRDNDPVPVVVTASGWHPAEQSFADWMRERLYRDYPFLSIRTVGGGSRFDVLLDAGLLLPIVDGLDELGDGLRSSTIKLLNQYLKRPRRRVVVTCRTEEYRKASRPGKREITLTGSVGLTIVPLAADTVTDYLESSAEGPQRAAMWLQVRDALRAEAGSTAAVALRTPLMVGMARQIYNPGDGDTGAQLPAPSELLDSTAFPDVASLRQHLFDQYVRAAYRPRPRSGRWLRVGPDDAERWLIQLARYQETTMAGSPDIEWWRFDQAVPHPVRAFFGAFIGGINVGLIGDSQQPVQGIAWSTRAFTRRFLYVVGSSLVVGLLFPIAPYGALAMGMAVGVVSGIVVGTRGEPIELPRAASPLEVLGRDRRLFWIFGPGLGFLAAVLFGASGALLVDNRAGIILVGLVAAFYAAAAGGMGKAAWGWFVLARWWWFLRRRAPLRAVRFLRDAHRRGVLRQVGAVWQFRHIDLQRRLALRDPGPQTSVPAVGAHQVDAT
ncbi:NACHT domain-containing protein [Paractinoplanes ferrugineus]|uniref:NACHT domain-containing protein n=2 Tax=Paractinoplanes ferrugineus TaxID=113564 RepID=A0A919MGE6_9ACTN|nr:hypothetical protein Afe05nite_56140 [Actinoplanes ferrugineus]